MVLECDRLGVPVISVREGWLDTSGPVRPLLVAIFGWVAEQERSRLIERTMAGLARARAQGKRLGRPPASRILLHAARDLVVAGTSVAEAAKRNGLSRSSLRRFLKDQTTLAFTKDKGENIRIGLMKLVCVIADKKLPVRRGDLILNMARLCDALEDSGEDMLIMKKDMICAA